MNIDTLQIKRITTNDAWNKRASSYIPAVGEYVLISTETMRALVIGDGKSSLSNLFGTSSQKIAFSSEIDTAVSELAPQVTPGSIYAEDTDNPTPEGTPNEGFAYANHSHKLTKSEVESILKTNSSDNSEFCCRRIMIGTADVNEVTGGKDGDIYIKVVK